MPVINQRSVRWQGIDERYLKFIDPSTAHEWSEERYLVDGDILWNSTGTGTIGRAALFRSLPYFPRIVSDSHVTVVRANSAIEPKYLFEFIRSPAVQNRIEDMQSGSTNQVELSRKAVLATALPLPPLAEQRRIVAKLDALFARLARARAELDRVPMLGRLLRGQALAACFGNLDWDKRELGTLLHGIEAGKNMRCAERPPTQGERGVVKVSAVTWGQFDPTESKTLPSDYSPPEKARIRSGDLLISRANTLELVGAAVLVEEEPRGLYLSDKILRLVVDQDAKKWVLWFLRSAAGRYQIESLATGNQLSMRNISQDALRRIKLPFPEKDVRQRLICRLEAGFARVARVEAEAARARTLLDRLESAILTKAFKGELVPQDPNDEPASVLLSRIKAGRAEEPQSPPKRGRTAAAPRVPRERAVMTKSRQDDDVKNQPYLADKIRAAGGSSTVEQLFKLADLSLPDFYKQLAWEVDHGHIIDHDNQELKAA